MYLVIKVDRCTEAYGPQDSEVLGFTNTKKEALEIKKKLEDKYKSTYITPTMYENLKWWTSDYWYDKYQKKGKFGNRTKEQVRAEVNNMKTPWDFIAVKKVEELKGENINKLLSRWRGLV